MTVIVPEATSSSELPTAVLGEVDKHATQRLDPRPTSPKSSGFVPGLSPSGPVEKSGRKLPATLILAGVLVVIIIGIISSVAYLSMRSASWTSDGDSLIYPGAQTIVDMTSDTDRAIQLQTGDPLEKVVAWYDASIKPTKTMRLTSTSVVLKNQNVTATIASEGDKTNILIKQRQK